MHPEIDIQLVNILKKEGTFVLFFLSSVGIKSITTKIKYKNEILLSKISFVVGIAKNLIKLNLLK